MDKVKCQICSSELKEINVSHLKKHNMSLDEYKIKFPNSELRCEELKKKHSRTWEDKFGVEVAKEKKEEWRKVLLERYEQGMIKKKYTKIHKYIFEALEIVFGDRIKKEYVEKYYTIDIALPDKKIAIEIQGDYFHNYANLSYDLLDDIQKKNAHNDKKKKTLLERRGWKVIYVWENEINKDIKNNFENIMSRLLQETSYNGKKKFDYSKIYDKEKSCSFCGGHLPYNRKTYCSRECKEKDMKRVEKKISHCKNCNVEIEDYKHRHFCSDRCQRVYYKENGLPNKTKEKMSESISNSQYNKERRKNRIVLICDCGKEFETHRCRLKSGEKKYCCRACYYKYSDRYKKGEINATK